MTEIWVELNLPIARRSERNFLTKLELMEVYRTESFEAGGATREEKGEVKTKNEWTDTAA